MIHNHECYEPAIDEIREIVDQSGKSRREIAAKSGLSIDTLNKLLQWVTKSPHHSTLRRIAKACGYEFRLVRVQERAEDDLADASRAAGRFAYYHRQYQ